MNTIDLLTPTEEKWLLLRWKSTLTRIEQNWKQLQKEYDRNSLIRAACTLERGREGSLARGETPRLIIDVDKKRPPCPAK